MYRLAAGEEVKRFIASGNQKPGRETARAFCWAATFKPKRHNPRHPDRTPLCPTIAEHSDTCLELASDGQFEGQGNHHTQKAFVRQAFRKYLSAASLRTVLPKQDMAPAATTASWSSPAKAMASAPHATRGAAGNVRRAAGIRRKLYCRRCEKKSRHIKTMLAAEVIVQWDCGGPV